MSLNKDSIRLRHMLEAAQKAVYYTHGRDKAALKNDELLAMAVVRLLEIIGEAAKHVSDELRISHSEIPWRAIAGTRDRLIHAYFDLDLDIVWEIVSGDLPELISHLEGILSKQTG